MLGQECTLFLVPSTRSLLARAVVYLLPLLDAAYNCGMIYKPRYTVDDYESWAGDWELWQGTAIAMTPSPFGVTNSF